MFDYTKLQAMIMPFNSTIENSIAVEKVVIDDNVYQAGQTTVLASVTKNSTTKKISLGITNGSTPAVIRFFTYKEES